MPRRSRYGFAKTYALRVWGSSYDVFTTAGVFRNVKGSVVRECYTPSEIAYLCAQKCFQPRETDFYVCFETARMFLEQKGEAKEKELTKFVRRGIV
jgi:hypothetical protein